MKTIYARGVCLLFITWVSFASARYQVCSITINSSDEIETFKKYLPEEDFEFIELVPSNERYYVNNNVHWFHEACRKENLKCDIVVVSGHFAGTFFGRSNQTLPIEVIEEKACQKSCGSILSQAKEVFLFGCNTLSRKKKDSRREDEYLQILLDDGLAREHAERVVSSRYSPIESSFHNRMKFALSGSDVIYGFDTVSPLGENIYPYLEKYFHSINEKFGSYASYLKEEHHKRDKNKELFKSLSQTSLSQTTSTFSEKDQTNVFYQKCTIYSTQTSFDQKLKSINRVFEEESSHLAFFAINHFLSRYEKEFKRGKGRDVFQKIKNNKSFEKSFQSLYDNLENLFYLRIVYLDILNKMEWISLEDFILKTKDNVVQLLQNPNSETYEVFSLLESSNQLPLDYLYITEKYLPKDYPFDFWSLLILEKLKIHAPSLQKDIVESCFDRIEEDKVYCYQALSTLAQTGINRATAQKLLSLLEHEDLGIILYTLKALGQSKTKDYFIHNDIASFITHKDPFVREEALKSLSFLKTPYSDIHYSISKMLYSKDKKWVIKILSALHQMNITHDETIRTIIGALTKYKLDQEVSRAGMLVFRNSIISHDITLDYFYNILESKNKETASFAVHILAHKNIRDLGIFYRFIRLLKDPNPLFRKEIFSHLSSLIWFHPEMQEFIVPFLLDEDQEVRQLTLDIFRNVENWNSRTYLMVKKLPNKNQEVKQVIQIFKQLGYRG